MPEKATIALDYSHNNKLTIETSSYDEFMHFLFTSGYKLGKIQAGFDSIKKLQSYDAIILSTPNNKKLEPNEIKLLDKYVKKGGSLLILSSMGGDHINKTNLNDLTTKFGFEFLSDIVQDSMNYVNLQKRPLITNITPHSITDQVKKLVFSSACSLKALEFIEDEENIKIEILATGGLNTWHRIHDGKDWIEEDSPMIPLLVVVEYYKGKVIAFGNLSMFSSLGREYGFSAFDNNIFIANIFKFLTTETVSEGQLITVNLNLDLFYWANKILEDQNWENISDVINLALKYFKDNYSKAIEDIKRIREEKVAKQVAYKKAKTRIEEESAEDKILEMIPVRKREDLEDIMSALEEVTGEKIEITIDLDEIEEKDVEERVLEVDGIKYTVKDTKEFNRETSKNAIWNGKPTKAFKAWLEKKEKKKEKISKKK
ncbi:MAG: hypothetical protein ACFFDO_02005 [Candidatus Thorarchaeota archaeon]